MKNCLPANVCKWVCVCVCQRTREIESCLLKIVRQINKFVYKMYTASASGLSFCTRCRHIQHFYSQIFLA